MFKKIGEIIKKIKSPFISRKWAKPGPGPGTMSITIRGITNKAYHYIVQKIKYHYLYNFFTIF